MYNWSQNGHTQTFCVRVFVCVCPYFHVCTCVCLFLCLSVCASVCLCSNAMLYLAAWTNTAENSSELWSNRPSVQYRTVYSAFSAQKTSDVVVQSVCCFRFRLLLIFSCCCFHQQKSSISKLPSVGDLTIYKTSPLSAYFYSGRNTFRTFVFTRIM